MEKYLYFNGSIRFYMEVFLDVGLVASLNLHTVDWNSPFPSIQASNYLSIVMIVLIVIWPLCAILKACCRPRIWRHRSFKDKFGTVLEGVSRRKLKAGERALLFASIMFYARRVAFIVSVLVFRQTLWSQLAIQNFISLSMVIHLQWYKPYSTNFLNDIETFNEVTILTLTYFLFCFTDFVPEPETRNKLSFYYIATSFFNMAVHLLVMLNSSFSSIRQSCRKRRHAKLRKQAQMKR